MSDEIRRQGTARKVKERIKEFLRTVPQSGEICEGANINLRVGEYVEIKGPDEILATLDDRGCLENLPFMPEMLQYCGRKFRVLSRADKTCDPANKPWSLRRMKRAVHIEGLRCDGSRHGGCEAGCLIFWKEAWLRRTNPGGQKDLCETSDHRDGSSVELRHSGIGTERLLEAASRTTDVGDEPVYRCQATEVSRFTSSMAWWDLRQYVWDVRSGNLRSGLAGESRSERALELSLSVIRLLQVLIIAVFNRIQTQLDGTHYPRIIGTAKSTPNENLDLLPGEVVQVRSKEEIFATLDTCNRNRGLSFDVEMLAYCGGIYKVLRRVSHIVDERTGKMLAMRYPCIVLDGVICRGTFHRLCPRGTYVYWREIWLRRISTKPVLSSVHSPPQKEVDRWCDECEHLAAQCRRVIHNDVS